MAARLHAPELEGSLAHLDIGHTKCGKIVLLRDLGAISADQATILHKLGRLRNTLVHNIGKVTFSFDAYVSGLDRQQLDNFINAFGHGIQKAADETSNREFVRSHPKLCVWLTTAELIACLVLETQTAELRLDRLALERYIARTKP